jgi:mannose-6-phosphate isomerase-like protein (cupin superfamily)
VAGYTKLNLTEDVDDSAQKFGMGEVLQAHFAREAIEAQKFGLSLQRLKPNQRMPFGHRHAEQEEVYVVVGGSGRLKVEDEVLELAQWDAVRVDPERVRNLEAGPDGLDVIAFGAPGVRDAEQLMNWWTD